MALIPNKLQKQQMMSPNECKVILLNLFVTPSRSTVALNCIVERTINEFASSRSVFFGNEAHKTKSSVLHSRRTRYGSKQMSLRALYF